MEENKENENRVDDNTKTTEKSKDEKSIIEEYEKRNKELEEYAKRMKASLENLRREKEDEVNYAISYANQKLIEKLVEVLDEMERLLKNFSDKNSLDYVALQMTYKRFKDTLEAEGLKKIETNGKFDPFEHDAVERVESPNHEDWDIVEVMQNGYKFRNKMIRPAKVKVAMHNSDSNKG